MDEIIFFYSAVSSGTVWLGLSKPWSFTCASAAACTNATTQALWADGSQLNNSVSFSSVTLNTLATAAVTLTGTTTVASASELTVTAKVVCETKCNPGK